MKRRLRAAALAVLLAGPLAACSSGEQAGQQADETAQEQSEGRVPLDAAATPPVAAPADPTTLTPAGLGALTIGKAPPADSGWSEDEAQLSESCRTLHSDAYPESYAMSDGQAIRRITAGEGSALKTARGIATGASEAEVRAAYPGIVEEPHKYVAAPGKYLTWMPEDGGPGLRFEIDEQGKVGLIHAGEMPWLGYVEGCA